MDHGLQLVFFCCSVLGLVGLIWTVFLVNDKPHPSLLTAETETDSESDPGDLGVEDGVEMKAGGEGRSDVGGWQPLPRIEEEEGRVAQ